jgi:hypothetical protein
VKDRHGCSVRRTCCRALRSGDRMPTVKLANHARRRLEASPERHLS